MKKFYQPVLLALSGLLFLLFRVALFVQLGITSFLKRIARSLPGLAAEGNLFHGLFGWLLLRDTLPMKLETRFKLNFQSTMKTIVMLPIKIKTSAQGVSLNMKAPDTGLHCSPVVKRLTLALTLLGLFIFQASAANETMSSGSYIVNMGVVPQTVGNGLKPYGLVYDLLKNYNVPIKWVINPAKIKDGTDFTYNGVDYKGGPFIIPAEYRTAAVNARITFWQGQGVQGVTTTSPVTVPVHTTLYVAPNWTLDQLNNAIAKKFFTNAGIPASSYSIKTPASLGCCDDLYVMPHADPQWSTHGNLFDWNLTCKGAIWLGCHAGSALHDMFDNVAPVNFNSQTNFLANKTGPAAGGGPYSENSLLLWGNHGDATLPLSYDYPTDPVMQFMGTVDAYLPGNGSEEIYVPKSPGWFSTTKVGVYDPDHPNRFIPYVDPKHRAAVFAWGPGLGTTSRGSVMLEGGHDIALAAGPANVAAQRAFFNFSLLELSGKAVLPTIVGLPSGINSGQAYPMNFEVSPPAVAASYTAVWTSSCGGSFSPSNTGQFVTYTPPVVASPSACNIQVVITDPCGRETFASQLVTVSCNLQVVTNITQPCFGGGNTGAINMTITGGAAPYNYSWTRTGGGAGSGTGTTISGLATGTYSVTVTANGGSGCSTVFSVVISALPQVVPNLTTTSVSCNGGSNGTINTTVTGGTPGFTYLWTGGATTQNRSGLTAGTYTVTVTDSKGCTGTASATISQPTAITVTPVVTPVNCSGQSTGAINLTVSGGVAPYSYLWSNGSSTQNISGLPAGTYAVTVTDANNCTKVTTGIAVTQPSFPLTLSGGQSNIQCFGQSTGSVVVSATGGTSPYTYDWNGMPTGDGTPTITNLTAGTYMVTVVDNKGCSAIFSATVTQPLALVLSVLTTNPTCPPSGIMPLNGNGAIDLTVSGGTVPYTYSWTTMNGAGLVPANQDQTGLTAGTYTVVVTDSNGCTASLSVTLTAINPNPVQPGGINSN